MSVNNIRSFVYTLRENYTDSLNFKILFNVIERICQVYNNHNNTKMPRDLQ